MLTGVAHTSLWTRYWQGSVHTAALPPTTIMQLVKRHGAAQEVLYGAGPQTNLLEIHPYEHTSLAVGILHPLGQEGPELQILPDTSGSSTILQSCLASVPQAAAA